MQEIYIGNGTTEYHLHSINEWLPSLVYRGVEGFDSPTMRIDAYDNPGIAGETVAQVLPGGSLLALSGALRAAHLDDKSQVLSNYTTERQTFLQAISHTYDDLGRAEPLLLRFTDLTGRELQADVYRDRYSAPLELPSRNEWRLQLRNPAGVFYSQDIQSAVVGIPTQGGVNFDIVWDVVFGDSSGGLLTVTNEGNVEAHPIIVLHGPMANPTMTNTATNEYIGIDHELLDGEIITIDTANSTIIQGETTNRMGTLRAGSVLWSLQPGENTITLQADEHTTGYAGVQWRDTYGGV
jgi:hypothetical protein